MRHLPWIKTVKRRWQKRRYSRQPLAEIDLRKVVLDPSALARVVALCEQHYGDNPGCALNDHWHESFRKDLAILGRSKRLAALNWVGGGFPKSTHLRNEYQDRYHLAERIGNLDTLDMQTGLHQFYAIDEYFKHRGIHLRDVRSFSVLEVGGGYGRLALFFLAFFGQKCHYVNIDFVPTSLAISPQVIRTLFPALSVAGELTTKEGPADVKAYQYLALPAWRIDTLRGCVFDLGINIHSYQEMDPPACQFYNGVFAQHLHAGAPLYFVNNPPDSGDPNNRYREHAFYGLEEFFAEKWSRVNTFTVDWQKICGVPSLERMLERK